MNRLNIAHGAGKLQSLTTFSTESEAEDFLKIRFDAAKLIYKQQHIIKGTRLRLDFVVRADGLLLPVEVKRTFRKNANLASAAQQANSYAAIIGRPVFIGPLVSHGYGHEEEIWRALHGERAILGRFNVGLIFCDHFNLSFKFSLSDVKVVNFQPNWGNFRVNHNHYFYRRSDGSKSHVDKMPEVSK